MDYLRDYLRYLALGRLDSLLELYSEDETLFDTSIELAFENTEKIHSRNHKRFWKALKVEKRLLKTLSEAIAASILKTKKQKCTPRRIKLIVIHSIKKFLEIGFDNSAYSFLSNPTMPLYEELKMRLETSNMEATFANCYAKIANEAENLSREADVLIAEYATIWFRIRESIEQNTTLQAFKENLINEDSVLDDQ